MIRWILAGVFLWLTGISSNAHPVHVSLCNLEIENEKMTVTIKLFLDDFQLALQHNYGIIIPYKELGSTENKNFLDLYVNSALQIVLNKKDSLRLSYDKTEINEEAIWLYYSVRAENINEMNVKNMLLLDIYSDQTNLLIVQFNGKQSGYRFNERQFEKYINLK